MEVQRERESEHIMCFHFIRWSIHTELKEKKDQRNAGTESHAIYVYTMSVESMHVTKNVKS